MKRKSCLLAVIMLLSCFFGQAHAEVLYSHDFDTLGGWPDSDARGDLNAVYTVVNGEYLINPLQNNSYILALAPVAIDSPDVVIESTMRLAASKPESRAGIACRVSKGLNFYFLGLVAKGNYEIVSVQDGKGTVLKSGQFPVGTLDNIKLRAECVDNDLIIHANGAELGRVTDKSLPKGTNVGLVSVSPVVGATNATFDDFTVSRGGHAAGATKPPAANTETSAPKTSGAGVGSGVLPVVEDIALYNDAGGKPGKKQSHFDTGEMRIHIVMKMSGNTKAKFTAKWYAILGAQEKLLLESRYDNASGNSRVWLNANRNWNAGLYRVDVYVDEQLLRKTEFTIN